MPREPGRPYREEDPSDGPSAHKGHHGHGDLEEAAFDLFRRILFPESHEHHPGEHHTEDLAELLRLLDSIGHSREFEEVLKEVEFYHPGIIEHLKHDDGGHEYVQGLYRRHTEESFDPSEWELDHGVGGEAATHWWDGGNDNTHSHEGDRPEYHSWDHRAEDHYWWHEKEGHPWEDHDQHWSHSREDHHWLPSAEDHPWDQAHDQRYGEFCILS
ncbi:hypothetical protein Pmar_PMAR020002 [Perkinsus marinus ATCC 50983]|uniref:Uncharacterized protein n=1 Tax=Perkinsus marinus (strain ATCC 50983 / TXsc) TaxID=423536 RepID=C5LJA8_PERM5|nr:hypothetical protein Pmar_PMAR020002 [Perkinsus marinus ATCC 50983]EER03224.1 hypothetical protein Pmar_PMAR020002 [Perkinsus marinus ATCC 50983]|eukprot:XP_002771408.1 hypothetical protein Pmar_PMAR020002 [Perkinsus marinus ATCC 50983]